MKELLERWAKLEPERIGERDHNGVYLVLFAGGLIGAWAEAIDVPFNRALGLAKLQAAVQEAIEARGWMGAVGFGGARGADAMVLKTEGADGADANGSTPAEALLSAYLTALEAQA
jgi:hypothetical protein